MSNIILMGTFHFPGNLDIYSLEIQEELECIVTEIAKLKPNKIALEMPYNLQSELDAFFDKFNFNMIADSNNFHLGDMMRRGQKSSYCYDNEIVQIGFRLATMLGISSIYGVDVDIEMSDELVSIVMPHVQTNLNKLNQFAKKFSMDNTLKTNIFLHNNDEYVKLDHECYISTNKINLGNYEGSNCILPWYERNIKKISNLQNINEKDDTIFVLIGSSHLKILRELIESDPSMKLTNFYQKQVR